MFEQYMHKKQAKNQINSDDELFQMLEEERNNRLIFKYISEGEEEKRPSDEANNEEYL